MRIQYHPSVREDVAEAMRRYKVVSKKLAADFKTELRRLIAIAAANPNRFHPAKAGLHRANLNGSHIISFIARFPVAFV